MINTKFIYWKYWIGLFVSVIICLLILYLAMGDCVIWLPILAGGVFTIAGVIGTLLYKKQHKDREAYRQGVKDKIARLEKRYNTIESIVKENFSILNFENMQRTLLSQISPTSNNNELISKINNYLQQIVDTQNNLEIFYINGEEKPDEFSNYSTTVKVLVDVYRIVLIGFIKFLNTHDGTLVPMNKADIISPFVNAESQLNLAIEKINIIDFKRQSKEKLLDVLGAQKDNTDKFINAIQNDAKVLLKYENSKIVELSESIK